MRQRCFKITETHCLTDEARRKKHVTEKILKYLRGKIREQHESGESVP